MSKMLLLQIITYLTISAVSPVTGTVKNTAPPAQIYYENQAIVLLYHEIKDNDGPYALSLKQFDEQLAALKANGYTIIPIEQFEDFVTGKTKSLPPNAIVLTFDDGYKDFYENAYPILKKYGMPATNFIVVKSSDVYNPDIIPHMTWNQMKKLKLEGMSFYSHTYDSHQYGPIDAQGQTGAILATPQYLEALGRVETEEEYYARIKKDLAKANELLKKHLGNTRSLLAFPYGKFTQESIDAGKALGTKLFFTIESGINTLGSAMIYRLNAGAPNTSGEALLELIKPFHTPEQ